MLRGAEETLRINHCIQNNITKVTLIETLAAFIFLWYNVITPNMTFSNIFHSICFVLNFILIQYFF